MERSISARLGVRSRSRAYLSLVSITTGILAVTLVIPFAFGDPAQRAAGGRGSDALSGWPTSGAGLGGPSEVAGGDTGASGAGAAEGGPTSGPSSAGGPAATSPSSGVGSSAPAGVELTASDVGVFPDRIKLGILLVDVGGISSVGVEGITDVEGQQAAFQTWVDEINEGGGILGRQIEPVYRTYDILQQESMKQACLYVTNDKKVFAVLDNGGFHADGVACVVQEYQTTLLSGGSVGMPKGFYDEVGPDLLFTRFMSGMRMMRNLAHELSGLGLLAGHKIGILHGGAPRSPEMSAELERQIEDLGGNVVAKADLSEDYSTGSAQIPLAVSDFRTAQVDTVILITNLLYGVQFVSQADQQRFFPQYVTSDWHVGSQDTYGSNMTDGFDGAISITQAREGEWRIPLAEPPAEAACRQIWERRHGQQLARTGSSESWEAYVSAGITSSCPITFWFAEAAERAGPNLTRKSLATAIYSLGPIALDSPLAAHMGALSFGPGKPDGGDALRTMRWEQDPCGCWKPIDDFRRVKVATGV